MNIQELEEAKRALRLTLETQHNAITVSKEELVMFVEYQSRFWKKWSATAEDKEALSASLVDIADNKDPIGILNIV